MWAALTIQLLSVCSVGFRVDKDGKGSGLGGGGGGGGAGGGPIFQLEVVSR